MLWTSWGPMKMLSIRASSTCSLSLSLPPRWAWWPWHRALKVLEASPLKKEKRKSRNNLKSTKNNRKNKNRMLPMAAWQWQPWRQNGGIGFCQWALQWGQGCGEVHAEKLLGDSQEAEGRDFLLIVLWFSLTFNVFKWFSNDF